MKICRHKQPTVYRKGPTGGADQVSYTHPWTPSPSILSCLCTGSYVSHIYLTLPNTPCFPCSLKHSFLQLYKLLSGFPNPQSIKSGSGWLEFWRPLLRLRISHNASHITFIQILWSTMMQIFSGNFLKSLILMVLCQAIFLFRAI